MSGICVERGMPWPFRLDACDLAAQYSNSLFLTRLRFFFSPFDRVTTLGRFEKNTLKNRKHPTLAVFFVA